MYSLTRCCEDALLSYSDDRPRIALPCRRSATKGLCD